MLLRTTPTEIGWLNFSDSTRKLLVTILHDHNWFQMLIPCFRSKSGDDLISLDQYIDRMKDGQKQIYYLTGQNREQLEKSPFLEKLLKKGYEVCYNLFQSIPFII